MSKHFISFQLTMRECAYSFNESIDGLTSFAAVAGVVPTIQSAANSTMHRARAIRHTGSSASLERTNAVKYRA
jgi:hypothetical protein